MKWLVYQMLSKEVRQVCGVAFVSMAGTNFHDSKFIKCDSAPGPMGPRLQPRADSLKLLFCVALLSLS